MQIIKRPHITEKSMMQASRGLYTFVVDEKANKNQIANAIQAHYKVTVVDVWTSIFHGKIHRSGKKMISVKKQNWKKAMVSLTPGQKIDAFEVHQEEAKK